MIVQIKQTRGALLEATVKGNYSHVEDLKKELIQNSLPFLKPEDFYLEHNGRILREGDNTQFGECSGNGNVVRRFYVVPRVKGGKGGFGSMLRAIGAQIEKTTNRDACRDLSGRRLRDINEEQRLKKWFARQKEREEERKERKLQKLNKLRQVADGPPLPKIDDQGFLQQREEIVDAVFEAVDEAFKGSKDVDAFNSDTSSMSDDTSPESSQDSKLVVPSSSSDGKTDSSKSSSETKQSSADTGFEAMQASSQGSSQASSSKVSSQGYSGSSGSTSKKAKESVKRTMFDEELDTDSSEVDSEDEPEEKNKQEEGKDDDEPSPSKKPKID